jgi:arylsulfatase
MIDHDKHVGLLLDKLDELGIAENTIVVYSTDNGPHMNSWPDGGMTPFRSEKDTNWEGAFRVPELIRWPGKIPAGWSRTTSSSTTTGCRRSWPLPATRTSSRS